MKNTYVCNRHFKVGRLIAAMVMLAAVTVTSCNTTVNTGAEQYSAVAFSEDGGVGTLTATVDGKPITLPEVVQKDKTVVFTVVPAEGYEVEKWTVNGTVVPGHIANTYSYKVTAKLAVKVSLKAIPAFTVHWNAFGHGTLTATVDGKPLTPGTSVFRDKTVVFTAVNDADYTIGKWAVSGGSFADGTGTEGNSSATVTITANTRVDVQFNPPVGLYHKIDYGTDGQELKDYLSSPLASSTEVSYIEITGLTKNMVAGEYLNASPLGKIITQGKRNVALRFGDAEIAGLTSMYYSFKGCTNLVEVSNIPASVTNMGYCFSDCTKLEQAPVIPDNVTNMGGCFSGCKKLTQAPVIPASVTYMGECFSYCTKLTAVTLKCAYSQNFDSAFAGCTGLQAGSITVPAHELNEYRANAGRMGVAADRFKAE